MRRLSVVRVRGLRHLTWRDAVMVPTALGFAAIGWWMVQAPGRFKYVQWLGEDGIARIGWSGIILFGLGAVAGLYLLARGFGVVPTLYAWTASGRVRVGPLSPLLTGRSISVGPGETVQVIRPHPVAYGTTHSTTRVFHWYLVSSRRQVVLATTFEPSQEHLDHVADWLTSLGLVPHLTDVTG